MCVDCCGCANVCARLYRIAHAAVADAASRGNHTTPRVHLPAKVLGGGFLGDYLKF